MTVTPIPLGEVATFIRGITFKPEDKIEIDSPDAVVCMRTKNVQDIIDQDDLIAIPPTFVNRQEQYLIEGDILVSTANSWELVGKSCWMPKIDYKATAGGFISILRANREKVFPRYLFHWMNSAETLRNLRYCGRQTTNISNMSFELARDLKLPLPPLPEQKRIAAILDKADSIRRKRQEVVRLTEELLRSVFLDMFGDPVTNPKGWETRAFAEVCETRLGKMLDAKQQTGEHLRPYLRNSNVQWDRIETSDLELMDFNEKDRKTFSLKDGDVLICEGGEVGRAAIWRNQMTDCYFQKAIHRARPNKSLALPEYVMFWLWFMSKNGGFKDHVTSATIAHLTGEKLKEIQMALPPITIQHQFLMIYNSLSLLKASTNKHQAQTEKLFNSTLQQVFNREFVEMKKAGI